MAHLEQQEFCQTVKIRFPDFFHNTRVLGVGSRNVNGSIRDEFADCIYTGIDAEAGNGVDPFCLGHESEALLNRLMWSAPLRRSNMIHMLSKQCPICCHFCVLVGFFMTYPGEGRKEHGTRKIGTLYGPDTDLYKNVSLARFLNWIKETSSEELYLKHNKEVSDLYCFAIKAQ